MDRFVSLILQSAQQQALDEEQQHLQDDSDNAN